MNRLICLILATVLSMSAFAVSASAYNEQNTVLAETVKPMYLYTNLVSTYLYINGSNAACTSTVRGKSTATKIEATQYLEKKVLWWWNEVEHWDKTVNDNYLNMNNSNDNLESGTYRVRTVATVYNGTNSELVEDTSNEVLI